MITLAFDSTARVASVAITQGERLLAQYNIDNGLTQSELLLPMAEDMLRALKMSFSDIKLLACAVGPGSFTGVRIGTALVKGLAFGKDIPCVAVSTLEALAENLALLDGVIVPVMDARRAQVYTSIFLSDGKEIKRVSEDVAIPLTELAEKLREYEGRKIYLSGDGYSVAKAAFLTEGILTEETPPLLIAENAYSVARVAYRKHIAGSSVTDRELNPTYLRLPQAERERIQRAAESARQT